MKSIHNIIEDTINSLDGINQAEVNPFLMTRIMEAVKKPVISYVKPILVKQWIISLMLVLMVNVAVGWYTLGKQQANQKVQESEYFTNQLYSY